MALETVHEFERVRLSVSGLGVTVTSWFDPKRQLWRANAPALLWLLGDKEEDLITGTTREKAVQAMQMRLNRQVFPARSPGRG